MADAVGQVRLTDDGPMLVDGPVVVRGADGSAVRSDRFVTAVCTCRRSKIYPLCDASHRTRKRVTAVRSEGDGVETAET
ncbi:CDGSH iron-sulfur domain-containing protein [Actinokineospora iranica]|uniref:Iron-binding zinc finger CDGSH type n=1 Tax=Actinokineospora iranica TaxID=1271860 RepID=A0A1G6S032_9PSEU|nr:CDGSH iron-sulfur domain-containing protein [Actinokineospora iranica]SDD10219.1 Iron-binding zinc finger CDGSH type [Actinokineospora iranica]